MLTLIYLAVITVCFNSTTKTQILALVYTEDISKQSVLIKPKHIVIITLMEGRRSLGWGFLIIYKLELRACAPQSPRTNHITVSIHVCLEACNICRDRQRASSPEGHYLQKNELVGDYNAEIWRLVRSFTNVLNSEAEKICTISPVSRWAPKISVTDSVTDQM